MKDVIKTGR